MIALNSAVRSLPVQVQPKPAAKPPENAGLVPTIERLKSARERQRGLESDARKAKKEADTLETALADATELAGGMLSAGPFVLGFEMKDGTPSYKTICEELIAENHLPPETLLERAAQTPMRRVLVIA